MWCLLRFFLLAEDSVILKLFLFILLLLIMINACVRYVIASVVMCFDFIVLGIGLL